ncbi:MAG: A/G-specific adenine glycosylase [Candidatus Brocadiia bacterium]
MDEATLREIGRRLLRWYEQNRRELPWRDQPSPYRVWVSEVMLQQTAVATVIPYFERWMERFPDVASLAEASEREVLNLWEGMGYYARARRLREAARQVMECFDGQLPDGREELCSLPGIGPYIVDATLSLAFGRDVVALDANVARVMMRLLCIRGRAAEADVRRRVRRAAETSMPEGRSSAFNQALMDFGSMICRPRRPLCAECPLRDLCRARAEGAQYDIPAVRRRRLRKIRTAVAVFLREGEVYVQKRPPEGMFAGMWEFPGGKAREGESPAEAAVRECREELGVECAVGRELVGLTHYYTVFEVRLHAFLCPPPRGLPQDDAHRWVAVSELDEYPMPSANRQVVQALREAICD